MHWSLVIEMLLQKIKISTWIIYIFLLIKMSRNKDDAEECQQWHVWTHYLWNFRLHYTWIDIGTPNVSFLVALDTGSDMFWVPCDCIECAPLSAAFYSALVCQCHKLHLPFYLSNIFHCSVIVCLWRASLLLHPASCCLFFLDFLLLP